MDEIKKRLTRDRAADQKAEAHRDPEIDRDAGAGHDEVDGALTELALGEGDHPGGRRNAVGNHLAIGSGCDFGDNVGEVPAFRRGHLDRARVGRVDHREPHEGARGNREPHHHPAPIIQLDRVTDQQWLFAAVRLRLGEFTDRLAGLDDYAV